MTTLDLERQYGAENYRPLPVVLTRGQGIHVWDDKGRQYIDMMSAYSAMSHGHCHPELVAAMSKQAATLAVTSRAYYSDQLGTFLAFACQMAGMDKALPMNSGAEGVETALKAARKWAYKIKGVPVNQAEIIVCQNNFHGRTIAIISMSTEAQYQDGFGPLLPGFKVIPYGDIQALEKAITPNTAAFLVEPIQGEGGVVVPPEGYLASASALCKKNRVLFIADEIQTGLARTGKFLACNHEQVQPDGLILGKALGGGLLPVSLFLASAEVMSVFTPGDHGSTFGGSPLASAVGKTALEIMLRENYAEKAAKLGAIFQQKLAAKPFKAFDNIRGKGLLIGIEINSRVVSAREFCLRLMENGVLSKETHETVVRLAPPLIITESELNIAIERILATAASFE